MCGPQILACLFTFQHIASKQLNSLITIDTLSWLGGAEVCICFFRVRQVLGLIPSSGKGFYVRLFVLLFMWFLFFVQKHYSSQNFAISFAMLIYLVYLTYCKICDRL